MQQSTLPLTKDLVLVGGGHSHALVLRKWGMNPLAGARLTLINPGPTAPYSGMLPGFLAGHYTRDELDIDLIRLAGFAQARVVSGSAYAIDTTRKKISVEGHLDISYDIASINVGITSDLPDLPGFQDHAVPAKPLGAFAQSWTNYLSQTGPARLAIIGAGVAGVEIALACAHALVQRGRQHSITLIDKGALLASTSDLTRAKLRTALDGANIETIENIEISRISAGGVSLEDGSFVEADFMCGAAGARAPEWLQQTGLDLTNGFVAVSKTLQSSDPSVFAVGDCAHMVHSPRPKAGVFAVRQSQTLFHNLRVALSETGSMRQYRPQNDYLKLISLGSKKALGERFGTTFQGAVVWKVKNHIDRSFMNRLNQRPKPKLPHLPKDRAAGADETLGTKPFCGGCGSKISQSALRSALQQAPAKTRQDIVSLPGDDAALLVIDETKQVISTDHLRAFVQDPIAMTKITANHALGDIWAMGATPQAATATVILPRMSQTLAERSLREIMETAQAVFADQGAAIVGGHSSFGSELTIGFTVTGLCESAPITLAGAKEGDLLILTKPIGSGVIMAGAMQDVSKGRWILHAIDQMCQPQAKAAEILACAHAMTDVTGFGLLGHVMNICQMSGVGADLDIQNVPLLPGALELSEQGIRSTLYPDNRQILPELSETPRNALLFDPQTAGGLLAAVPPQRTDYVDVLKSAGYEAAIIGKITAKSGQISLL